MAFKKIMQKQEKYGTKKNTKTDDTYQHIQIESTKMRILDPNTFTYRQSWMKKGKWMKNGKMDG